MIRVGIIGGTGYTGIELIRLLLGHCHAELVAVTSRQQAGQALGSVFPSLANKTDLVFVETLNNSDNLDIVFVAAGNGVAMQVAPDFLAQGVKVIDLSADFRIQDVAEWEKWYKQKHHCPELLGEAIYGLPEINRESIKKARLIANPGCYPTSVILGCLPLLQKDLLDTSFLVADAKSGASGAGRQGLVQFNLSELDASLMAYGASEHRHYPEILGQLKLLRATPLSLSFTPHLVPMVRGIFTTLSFESTATVEQINEAFVNTWGEEPFVSVLAPGAHPQTRFVRGTNMCHIAVHKQGHSDIGKVLVVIDNLVKGASGQAVQNMNLMFGMDEAEGLGAVAVIP